MNDAREPERADVLGVGLERTDHSVTGREYDTNLFLDFKNGKKDAVSRTVPGFPLEYSVGPVALTLGYKIEQLTHFIAVFGVLALLSLTR